MKKSKAFLASLFAMSLVAGVSAGTAHAYFTTYVTAKGGHTLELENRVQIEEDVKAMEKQIALTNTGKTSLFVRVKVFSGSQVEIQYRMTNPEEWVQGQTDENGFVYWYYTKVLHPGETSSSLFAKIVLPEGYEQSFDVVVVQESTFATADEDTNETDYRSANWNVIADTTTGIGTINNGGGRE